MATQSSALAGEALVSYSPWGRKESDTAEHTHTLSLAGNRESVFLHTAGSNVSCSDSGKDILRISSKIKEGVSRSSSATPGNLTYRNKSTSVVRARIQGVCFITGYSSQMTGNSECLLPVSRSTNLWCSHMERFEPHSDLGDFHEVLW